MTKSMAMLSESHFEIVHLVDFLVSIMISIPYFDYTRELLKCLVIYFHYRDLHCVQWYNYSIFGYGLSVADCAGIRLC